MPAVRAASWRLFGLKPDVARDGTRAFRTERSVSDQTIYGKTRRNFAERPGFHSVSELTCHRVKNVLVRVTLATTEW